MRITKRTTNTREFAVTFFSDTTPAKLSPELNDVEYVLHGDTPSERVYFDEAGLAQLKVLIENMYAGDSETYITLPVNPEYREGTEKAKKEEAAFRERVDGIFKNK